MNHISQWTSLPRQSTAMSHKRSGAKCYGLMRPRLTSTRLWKSLSYGKAKWRVSIFLWWTPSNHVPLLATILNLNKVWRKKGSAHDPNHASSSVKHGGGSVMAWTCMAASGVGSLILIDDIPHGGNSRINSEVYKNISVSKLMEGTSSCSKTMTQNTVPT